jgi:mannose-6-phosphate isomerase-like protein (cupin superfamily)
MSNSQAVITRAEEWPREEWDDPQRGSVAFRTLFSSDVTPTDSMCAGIAEIVPGGGAKQLHSHAEAEIYYILEGTGILTIDDVETVVTPGRAVFIPGHVRHGLRNESTATVKLFYVFPTGRFGDVTYRFFD